MRKLGWIVFLLSAACTSEIHGPSGGHKAAVTPCQSANATLRMTRIWVPKDATWWGDAAPEIELRVNGTLFDNSFKLTTEAADGRYGFEGGSSVSVEWNVANIRLPLTLELVEDDARDDPFLSQTFESLGELMGNTMLTNSGKNAEATVSATVVCMDNASRGVRTVRWPQPDQIPRAAYILEAGETYDPDNRDSRSPYRERLVAHVDDQLFFGSARMELKAPKPLRPDGLVDGAAEVPLRVQCLEDLAKVESCHRDVMIPAWASNVLITRTLEIAFEFTPLF